MNGRLRLAVLGSGKGSNCRAILEAIERGALAAEVVAVVADVADAGILSVANAFQVPAWVVNPGPYRFRLAPAVETELGQDFQARAVDLIVLAGFMRIIKTPLLQAFPRRIINIHPSLLPAFPGLEAWKQALAARVEQTGCTVHYVEAGIDTGEIIAQRVVPVLPADTPESLHERIQAAEHALLPEVLQKLARELVPGNRGIN